MPRKRIGKLPPGDTIARRLIRLPQSQLDWANAHGGLAYVARELIGIQMRLEVAGQVGWLPKVEPGQPRPTREQVLAIVREARDKRRQALREIVATYEMLGEEVPGYGTLQKMLKKSGLECSKSTVKLDLEGIGKGKSGM